MMNGCFVSYREWGRLLNYICGNKVAGSPVPSINRPALQHGEAQLEPHADKAN
jgi:hypothetical protein